MPPDLFSLSLPLFTQCACVCVCCCEANAEKFCAAPQNNVQNLWRVLRVFCSGEIGATATARPAAVGAPLGAGGGGGRELSVGGSFSRI